MLHSVLVRSSVEAVVVPLRDGLVSINRVYEALIDADVDPFTGQCSDYKRIRAQIVQAERSLQQSEQVAGAELKSLDESTEVLTRDLGRFERELSHMKQTLENLKSTQMSNKKLQRECEGALQQARSDLNSTKDTLRRQEERKRNAEIVTGVGAGLFLIPVVGWIAGEKYITHL